MSVIKNKRTKTKVNNSMQPLDFSDTASSTDLKKVNRLLAGSQSQSAFPANSWGNVVANINHNKIDAQSLYEIVASSEFYDSTSTYDVGDIVVVPPDYSNAIPAGLWRCTVAISTPEEFDTNHWESVDILSLIGSQSDSDPVVYEIEPTGESLPYCNMAQPLESNGTYLMCLNKLNEGGGFDSKGLYLVHVPVLTSSLVYLGSSDYTRVGLLGDSQFIEFLMSTSTFRLRASGAPVYGYKASFIKMI